MIKFRLVRNNKTQGILVIGPTSLIVPAYEWDTAYRFSGMKDKNGIDIYEGDILELLNDRSEKIRVVCEYGIAERYLTDVDGDINLCDISGFYFKLKSGKKTFPIVINYMGYHDLEIMEVIGTIYENPELIQQ